MFGVAERRVRRGAKFLDEVRPGWFRDVDPLELNLLNGRQCVLGQLEGHYDYGMVDYNIRWGTPLGFFVWTKRQNAKYTKLWWFEIAAREAASMNKQRSHRVHTLAA